MTWFDGACASCRPFHPPYTHPPNTHTHTRARAHAPTLALPAVYLQGQWESNRHPRGHSQWQLHMEILRTPTLWLPSPTPFPLLSRPNASIFPHRGFGVEGLEWYQKQCLHIYGHVGIGDRGRSSKCHNFFDFWSRKLMFFTKLKPRRGESTQKVDFQNGPFPGDPVDVQKYDRVSKFTLDLVCL